MRRTSPRKQSSSNSDAAARAPVQTELADQAGIAIRRAAVWLPWRSDCLVQAVAAEPWLAARGAQVAMNIGVRQGLPFAPHAWVTAGDRVVVGGDVSDQVQLIATSRQSAAVGATRGGRA